MFAVDNADFGFDSGHEIGADFDPGFAEAHTIADDDRRHKHHAPIVPSTVKQVLEVPCEHKVRRCGKWTLFVCCCRSSHRAPQDPVVVCVVGLVSRIEDTPLALRIWIEDGTAGELQVDYWSDSPAHHCDKDIRRFARSLLPRGSRV